MLKLWLSPFWILLNVTAAGPVSKYVLPDVLLSLKWRSLKITVNAWVAEGA